VVIDRGKIRKRKKKPSKKFCGEFEHTPLSLGEHIPWECRSLVIRTGAYAALPVMKELKLEAEHRQVELLIVPTAHAIEALQRKLDETNAILHVTCWEVHSCRFPPFGNKEVGDHAQLDSLKSSE